MTERFDGAYWDEHWTTASDRPTVPPHPALAAELAALRPGTALDAGSGDGAEAAWLAARGWEVTAVDISAEAHRRAADRFPIGAGSVSRIEADLTVWHPDRVYDLVTTFYAHPAIPQLAFYERIARWVAPRGTLLIVGHHRARDTRQDHASEHDHPENAVTAPELIRDILGPATWEVHTASVSERDAPGAHGGAVRLRDVTVRASRR